MKRQVFISTDPDPLALFPEEEFTQKNEIYYNDSKIIITKFEFFALMTILELEEEANEKISGKMRDFLRRIVHRADSVENLLFREDRIGELKFHAKKRAAILIMLVFHIEKLIVEENVDMLVKYYIQQAKQYIEEFNIKKLMHIILNTYHHM